MTIISAIEQGKIPPYDAPAVCATYPGEGWRYDSDRFCWERAASDPRPRPHRPNRSGG